MKKKNIYIYICVIMKPHFKDSAIINVLATCTMVWYVHCVVCGCINVNMTLKSWNIFVMSCRQLVQYQAYNLQARGFNPDIAFVAWPNNDLHNNDINNYTGKGFEIMYNKYINRRTIIWKQWGLLHHVRTIIYVKELFIMS